MKRIFDFNELDESEVLANDQLIYLQRKRKSGNNEFHIVNAGESLYTIAQAEAMRLESLLEFNQLQKNMKPAVGQRLYLRGKAPVRPDLASELNMNEQIIARNERNESAATASYVQNAAPRAIIYTVQAKETIYSIAKRYNVKIDDLVDWNQLNSYSLKKGQQLKIYK